MSPPPSEPLTEEITYREITDVLMALSGEGQPGKPQITAPNLQESPILAALRDLEPQTGATDEVCGKAAAAAGQLGVKRKDAENYHQEGYVERDIPSASKRWPRTAMSTSWAMSTSRCRTQGRYGLPPGRPHP